MVFKGGFMVSFNRLPGGVTAVAALAGAAVVAAPAAAQARSAATVQIPCRTSALVSAINNANGSSGTIIVLPGNCNYDITTAATATDGLPVITGNVTLAGGHNTVIRRRTATTFRIFEVASGGTLGLSSVSVEDGRTSGLGGAILNAGTVVLNHASLSDNTAANGGGIANNAGATARVSNSDIVENTTTSVGGGAIINFASLTVNGSILSGNTAPINGGGINTQPGGTTRLNETTVSHNTSGSLGGGLSNLGTTSLDGSTVTQNKGSSGGGIATGNTNVTLRGGTVVRNNTPDNCSPINTIPGCVN
jgi:hypothetical protein